jgi:hypothetical protein
MSIIIDRACGAAAITLVLPMSGCANVQRDARLPDVRAAVGQRVEKNVSWNRGNDQDRRAPEAVRRLLQLELTAEAAVQIALLNNRNRQAIYERLGGTQADLIDAGLLENPVFCVTVYSRSSGTDIEASIVQDFVGLFSSLKPTRRQAPMITHRQVLKTGAVILAGGTALEATPGT